MQLSTTHRLLLRFARLDLTDEDRALVVAHAPEADWAEIFELARLGGVSGLVSRHIEREGLPVPAEWRRRFSLRALATEARNRVLVAEALRLCAAAEERGLTLIPLKGAALSMVLYDDLGLRPMVDLDLLTRRDEVQALGSFIATQGYKPFGEPREYLRWYHHLAFVRQIGSVAALVELHWTALHVMYSRPELDAELVSRSRLRSVEEKELRLLDPTAMLLSVALHVAVHRYRAGLKWLVDVAELARTSAELARTSAELARTSAELARTSADAIDWDWLWRTARAAGARRALAHVFELARALLGAPLPATRTSWLRSALGRLAPPEALVRSASQPPLLHSVAINLLQYDSPLDGLAYAFHKGAEVLERTAGIELPRWLARRNLLGLERR